MAMPRNGPRNDDAPPRPAQTQTGRRDRTVRTDRRDTGQRYDQRRVRCAFSSQRTVVHIVTAAPAPRQAASPYGEVLSQWVATPQTLPDGAGLLAADAFADGRLALGVASALAEIVQPARRAVEMMGSMSAGGEIGAC